MSPIEGLDESWEDWRQELGTRLCEHLGDVLELTGQHDQARAVYRQALSHVPAADRAWIVRLLRLIGNTYKSQSRYDEALRAYGIAAGSLGLDPASADTRLWREWLEIQFSRMLLYYGKGDAGEMLALAEQTGPVVEKHGTLAHRLSAGSAGVNAEAGAHKSTWELMRNLPQRL